MSVKSIASKVFAAAVKRRVYGWASRPAETQRRVFKKLIRQARHTAFGKDHGFDEIKSHADFTRRVPIRDYEQLRPYMNRVVEGEKDILWPGRPLYFAKTSGTTSGAKYIPISSDSMPYHISAARNALLLYIAETGNTSFVDGKVIFLQGSPVLGETNGIKTGRLSGIVAHYVPAYLRKNRLPSWETNCIDDWEAKVSAIVNETLHEDMALISGIPSWVQTYFEQLVERGGKPVGELFKNFNLFVYGGLNYEPYRAKFESLIGRKVDSIETFPASEGFFAFQDKQDEKGMLLQLNSGMFYEFVKADELFDENPERLTIGEVKTGVNYVMLVSSNAGLWAYNPGDTVQFTSTDPYRVIVSGRVAHFISAFGEHVIGKEVEQALQEAVATHPEVTVSEFTVAPNITPAAGGLPNHQWLMEFENPPKDMDSFATAIDRSMQRQNSYYRDLIQGKILRLLEIIPLKKGAFNEYMKQQGKLGGQNKLPRLSNDRKIADVVVRYSVIS